MKDEKEKRTPEEYNLAKNMYITVWQSLSSAPKNGFKFVTVEVVSTCLRTVGNCVCLKYSKIMFKKIQLFY